MESKQFSEDNLSWEENFNGLTLPAHEQRLTDCMLHAVCEGK